MNFGPEIKPDFVPLFNGPLFSKHGRQIILALDQNRVYSTALLGKGKGHQHSLIAETWDQLSKIEERLNGG
jgi:hypothetical protein